MSGKTSLFWILLVVGLTAQLHGQQESYKVLSLSETIGEEIDQEEKERYGLFPGIENFMLARIIQTGQEDYVLQLQVDENGQPGLRSIPLSLVSLENLRRQVHAVEGVQEKSTRHDSFGTKSTPIKSSKEIAAEIDVEEKRGLQVFPGYLGSLFGGFVTLAILNDFNTEIDSRAEFYAVWGVGSAFFSSLIVHSSGKFGRSPALYPVTFLGSLIGSGLGILAVEGSLQLESSGLAVLAILFIKPILTSMGGIKGYHAGVKSRINRNSALLNYHQKQMDVGIPAPYMSLSPGASCYENANLAYQMQLVQVSF